MDWTRHPIVTLPGELCENDLDAELAYLAEVVQALARRAPEGTGAG